MSDSSTWLRAGTIRDAAEVVALLNRIIRDQDGTALSTPVSVEEETAFLTELLQAGFLMLATQNERLLSFQSVNRLSREVGEIGTFVAREARGRGTGRRLLEGVSEWAICQDISTLIAEVAVNNAAGLQAYRAWGFVELSLERRVELEANDMDISAAPDKLLLELRLD